MSYYTTTEQEIASQLETALDYLWDVLSVEDWHKVRKIFDAVDMNYYTVRREVFEENKRLSTDREWNNK